LPTLPATEESRAMPEAITLYDCATAPSPRRARILLAEKGVAHQTVMVDLRSGAQFGPAFRAVNPQCTVPVLQLEDGLTLTDNAAILAYAEARWPEPPLLGRTPEEKAAVAHWHWRAEFEGLLAVAEALRNSSPAMADRALPGAVNYPQIPALAERGLARLQHFFDALEAQLAGQAVPAGETSQGGSTGPTSPGGQSSQPRFLAGAHFSVADITALVAVDFARIVKAKPDPARHPHLLAWRSRLGARASVAL
jgi:glutathione S-transferase